MKNTISINLKALITIAEEQEKYIEKLETELKLVNAQNEKLVEQNKSFQQALRSYQS